MSRNKDIGFGLNSHRRLLNDDGKFNVQKINGSKDIFQHLIECSVPHFISYILLFYVSINILFAILFNIIGIENLEGIVNQGLCFNLFNAFFFSVQTFTTVGYGAVHPIGNTANILASIDALTGILSVSIISGLLLVRITQRKSGIIFSNNAVILPYDGMNAVMFRIVNSYRSELIEVNARVLVSFFRTVNGEDKRNYLPLVIEQSEVMFFPLSWTIVHKIDENSPLYGISAEEMIQNETEIIILISGYDEMVKEKIYTKNSYTAKEILWNHKFVPAFDNGKNGKTIIDIKKIHETFPLEVI